MESLIVQCHNDSGYQNSQLLLGPGQYNGSTAIPLPKNEPNLALVSTTWVTQIAMILVLSGLFLYRYFSTSYALTSPSTHNECKDPPQVPYVMPVVGNMVSYLLDAASLASSITQTFGASAIVRLNFLTKEVYVVYGAEYLKAVWKNTKGLTSTNGINLALSNMFDTPKEDMMFFKADGSGITADPHPQSSTRPEDRVFHLMHKATVDCLAGSHLMIAAQKFQIALVNRVEASPVTGEWIEMDDLFAFVLPLISYSTIEAMCGTRFLRMFPTFFDDFWNFNRKMPKLLQGWPRWMMPKAWQAREQCIATMKKWREVCIEENFDGNAMITRRWSYFSRMQGLSKHGVACSDLGILWGMNSNSTPATFWLIWHMLRDPDLFARASYEVDTCRIKSTHEPMRFDTTKLCNQPLLQSSYAETLRRYVAVYIIREPEHEDAQILDYRVPKSKMIVINSAMAHKDRRNWPTGPNEEHPVATFWADRFLTYNANAPQSPPTPLNPSLTSAAARSSSAFAESTASNSDLLEPKFSLNGYNGAWIPFGGGIHQCPGRHWVKVQMLLTFAVINAAFDIELLGKRDNLRVDMVKYGLGTLSPGEKARFRIRRKKTTP